MDWTTIVVAVIAAGGWITSFATVILQRRWTKQDEAESKKTVSRQEFNGLKTQVDALVRWAKINSIDRVRYLGLCYIGAKEIAMDDKRNLREMYDSAKGLGLDGDLDIVMQEVDKLPVVGARFKKWAET